MRRQASTFTAMWLDTACLARCDATCNPLLGLCVPVLYDVLK